MGSQLQLLKRGWPFLDTTNLKRSRSFISFIHSLFLTVGHIKWFLLEQRWLLCLARYKVDGQFFFKLIIFLLNFGLRYMQESKVLKFLGFMWNPLSWVMEAAAIMAIALANGGVSSLFLCFSIFLRRKLDICYFLGSNYKNSLIYSFI